MFDTFCTHLFCALQSASERGIAMLSRQDDIYNKMQPAKRETEISICDILKNNTTKVIRKLESHIPTNVQAYSDLYSNYLHMLDDYFGTCYLWQKQYFDTLGFDSQTLNAINDYFGTMTDLYCNQIEMFASAQKFNIVTRENMMKICDQHIHQMLDYYGRVFSQMQQKVKN